MKNNLNGLKRNLNNIMFQAKKYSPEILAAAGVVGIVASSIMACKATTKLSEVLEESKDTIDKIHECSANDDLAEKYTEEDASRDLAITYVQTGLKIAKLYAPSVALGTLSIASLLTSNNILRKRNVALAAAYTTVDSTFKKYRDRVVKKLGEEADKEFRYGVRAEKVEETIEDENGKMKKVKKTINVVDDPSTYSDYAKFFDESSPYWEKNPEYNLLFLRQMQDYANDKLRVEKRLFLNDVYEMLGIPKTKAGQVIGWVYDEENPIGDNFVDFGIYDVNRSVVRDFVNGYEPVILLDFNVDGDIWTSM